MKVTQLQNIKVYRIQDDNYTEEIIIIMDEGELEFYKEIEIKYSNFEKALLKEMINVE